MIIAAVLVTVQIAAIVAAIRAVRTARTPQGAVGWVVFLLSAPYLAFPAYLIFGHSRFPGYVSARRSSERVIDAVREFGREHPAHLGAGSDADANTVQAFEGMTKMPVVSGNAARLLIDGEATFDAILAAIDGAQSYVFVQYYILRDDRIGRALKDRLVAKAKAGCKVRVLYDGIGSHSLPDTYLEELEAAGAVARNFHSIRQPRSRLQLNFRNHRKIVIVDGRTGFVGGLNVGDEYMGRDSSFGHWRDTHLGLEGPVVAQLQLIFLEDWYWATEEQIEVTWHPERQEEDLDALIVASGPADPHETGSLYFCNAINAARERIWIASPYFVPDTDILRALQLAAMRGVDVRILMPDRRDQLLVWLAAFAFVRELEGAGIRVLRYAAGFMHQKVLVVDDRFASVGTINLDNRSCRLNFEVTALIFDKDFVAEVADMLEADFARSIPHAERVEKLPGIVHGLGAAVARLFAPIL